MQRNTKLFNILNYLKKTFIYFYMWIHQITDTTTKNIPRNSFAQYTNGLTFCNCSSNLKISWSFSNWYTAFLNLFDSDLKLPFFLLFSQNPSVIANSFFSSANCNPLSINSWAFFFNKTLFSAWSFEDLYKFRHFKEIFGENQLKYPNWSSQKFIDQIHRKSRYSNPSKQNKEPPTNKGCQTYHIYRETDNKFQNISWVLFCEFQ